MGAFFGHGSHPDAVRFGFWAGPVALGAGHIDDDLLRLFGLSFVFRVRWPVRVEELVVHVSGGRRRGADETRPLVTRTKSRLRKLVESTAESNSESLGRVPGKVFQCRERGREGAGMHAWSAEQKPK